MGRNAEPIDLIIAKGRTHLTRKEILERRAAEIPVEVGNLTAPSYLSKAQREKFDRYAGQLCRVGFRDLDVDCLGRYIIAHDLFVEYTARADREQDLDRCLKWSGMASKSFDQAHKCASALGLTITSRCKLTLPESLEDDEL